MRRSPLGPLAFALWLALCPGGNADARDVDQGQMVVPDGFLGGTDP